MDGWMDGWMGGWVGGRADDEFINEKHIHDEQKKSNNVTLMITPLAVMHICTIRPSHTPLLSSHTEVQSA